MSQGGGGGAFDGIDNEQIERIAQNISVGDAMRILGTAKRMFIDPHLVDIRQNVIEDYPDPLEVREKLEDMPEEDKEEIFYETLHELIKILEEIRIDPETADYQRLKAMIRDPYTMEALLVFFENPEHIDPQYSDQLKEFVSEHARLLGVLLFPTMYTDAERRRVLRKLDWDPDDVVGEFEQG